MFRRFVETLSVAEKLVLRKILVKLIECMDIYIR